MVCQNIPIGEDFSGKRIKAGCQDNTIGSGCQSKPIGAECQGKPIGAKCQGQSVGLGCQRKPVGQDVKINLAEEVFLAQEIMYANISVWKGVPFGGGGGFRIIP